MALKFSNKLSLFGQPQGKQWHSRMIICPVVPAFHTGASVCSGSFASYPALAYGLGKEQKMPQTLDLVLTWETWGVLLALCFWLSYSWPLKLFGELTSQWKTFSICLLLFLYKTWISNKILNKNFKGLTSVIEDERIIAGTDMRGFEIVFTNVIETYLVVLWILSLGTINYCGKSLSSYY